MRYNPRTSIFAGMSPWQLRQAIESLQAAYLELMAGGKVVTASYAQGDGTKSVTYTAAQGQNIVNTILQLRAQLGEVRHPRRGFRVGFR
jgi:hypothetical protein